uniref:Transposase family Tnp2 protein n=1 Tax=Mycena chlorophos TaxID=658473 RepID=A0ABQ0M1G8_MYCCL|nr:predicted protein [Mycena chlorophos]
MLELGVDRHPIVFEAREVRVAGAGLRGVHRSSWPPGCPSTPSLLVETHAAVQAGAVLGLLILSADALILESHLFLSLMLFRKLCVVAVSAVGSFIGNELLNLLQRVLQFISKDGQQHDAKQRQPRTCSNSFSWKRLNSASNAGSYAGRGLKLPDVAGDWACSFAFVLPVPGSSFVTNMLSDTFSFASAAFFSLRAPFLRALFAAASGAFKLTTADNMPKQRVWCAHCDSWTSRRHEQQYRRLANLPQPSSLDLDDLPPHERVDGPSSEPDYAYYSDIVVENGGDVEMDEAPGRDYGFEPNSANRNDEDPTALDIEPELLEHWHLFGKAAQVDSDDEDGEVEQDDTLGDGQDDEPIRVEHSDGEDDEDSDDEPDIFDWDSFEAEELSAELRAKEGIERELAEIAHKLSAYDIAICRAFAYKVETNTTDSAFKKAQRAFPQTPPLPNLHNTRRCVDHLAGFKPQIYDCCVNSCLCYVGPHKDLIRCSYCNEIRYRTNGKPRKRFTYIPIIPRLLALLKNPVIAEKMRYRADFKQEADHVDDVFGGTHYANLRERLIHVNGKPLKRKYFADTRDIALGASMDGFAPFKRRKKTAWPIILFLYNLPPDLRFLLPFILALGVIPGPNKPKDSDSFLWPLVEELLRLAHGVPAFDVLSGKMFLLHAFLILVFGDIPAVSMFMRMKGHNGISPCRMCKIIGLRVPNAKATTHYVPHDRSRHPEVKGNTTAVKVYDMDDLPLRTHDEILRQAHEVEDAPSNAAAERLAKQYGVKGVPLLSFLDSLSFPGSFPYDFMHLIWENLIKNLVLLWTGGFKGLDQGTGSYEIDKTVWEAVASLGASAGNTVPSAYGSRVPNISKDNSNVSAEMWGFWTQYLGPVLLHRRFKNAKYYLHFIELVRLLNICLQFEITDDDIEEVRVGFINWVQTYEKYYYQYKPSRIAICPLTIHALLHIAASMKFCGPVWAYWAFPMERFCGTLSAGIRSRRHPWASLDRHVFETAQLAQIKTLYNVVEELSLDEPRNPIVRGSFSHPSYPACVLLPPKSRTQPEIEPIVTALATRLDCLVADARAALRVATVEEYGKVKRVDTDEGDTMHSCSLGTKAEDARDASYVRYEALIDQNASKVNAPILLKKETFYGRLTRIYRVTFDAGVPELDLEPATTIIFAAVRVCKLESKKNQVAQLLDGLNIHFYSGYGALEVLDITTLQGLVGRVPTSGGRWAIIDRNGPLRLAEWADEIQY